jgi:hypothetical protein
LTRKIYGKNDNETSVVRAYHSTDDAVRSANNEQRKTRLDKVVRDVAAVASDPSKPKTRRAVQEYLTLCKKNPAVLEAFRKKMSEKSSVHNAANNH